MQKLRLAAVAAFALFGLVTALTQVQSVAAFGPDNECTSFGDCQGITCSTNTGVNTGDTAVIFGNGGGGVAVACGNGFNPNLAVVSSNSGGLAFASASFGGTGAPTTAGAVAKASADGAGSLAGAQAFNGTVGVSTTAGATGLAIASAVNTASNGLANTGANGAFGLSAFGGETIAAPNVTLAPGQVSCLSVGTAIAATFSYAGTPSSSLCVGNHVVIAGQ